MIYILKDNEFCKVKLHGDYDEAVLLMNAEDHDDLESMLKKLYRMDDYEFLDKMAELEFTPVSETFFYKK